MQRALIERTRTDLGDRARMQIAPEQGSFMTLLARLVGARFAVEVGTFTGYSALCIARGLVPGGRLLCCDVDEAWVAIGREHWALAGVDDRIDVRIAPAAETLAALPREPDDRPGLRRRRQGELRPSTTRSSWPASPRTA